jgi:hypothetical protein
MLALSQLGPQRVALAPGTRGLSSASTLSWLLVGGRAIGVVGKSAPSVLSAAFLGMFAAGELDRDFGPEDVCRFVSRSLHGHGFGRCRRPAAARSSASITSPPRRDRVSGTPACIWPKSRYSDEDGYLQINVRTVKGPGEGESTGTSYAGWFTAPCPQLVVGDALGLQGGYGDERPFIINADNVVVRETQALWKTTTRFSFIPTLASS